MTERPPLVAVEIDLRSLDDPDHLAAEFLVTVIHRILGWVTGKRIVLRPFPSPP